MTDVITNDLISLSAKERRDAYSRPERPAYIGFAIIAAFVLIFGIWSYLAPVSGAAIAEGALQVQGQRQSVQHPYGGVVQDLFVKEGDQVKRGQVLLTLSDTEPRSKVEVLQAERVNLVAQQARLNAERENKPEPNFGDELTSRKDDKIVAQAMANERAIMGARERQYETEKGVLERKIAQLREQQRGLEAQRDGVARQQALMQEEANGAKQLLKSGYTPKTRVLALERQLAGLESQRGARLSDIAGVEQAIGQAELEITKLDRTRLSDIVDQLRATESKLAEVTPQLDAARDVLKRTKVTAPATGSVVGLTVFTEGGVIQPGAKLLDIVPSENPLMVDARLPLSDVDQVKPGRRADVRLVSVNRNERPQLHGTIVTVSADRMTDTRTGAGYYNVQVKLDEKEVSQSHVALQAGMPAEVIVATQPRTLMQYLIGPLTDQITTAFRER